jgi:signal transduction histidine kinase
MISEIIKNCRYLTDDKSITFKKYFSKTQPKARVDTAQIREVISNIITNSIQAIPNSGEVKIKTSEDESDVFIEISDSGTGIPKENLDKIFIPFYSSKEYGKGTGLGLSIAKKVIKEHDGDISVKSYIGKGTTFSIRLPK